MKVRRSTSAIGLVALVIMAGSPAIGQTPRSGGWLTLRLREDMPQGFAMQEVWRANQLAGGGFSVLAHNLVRTFHSTPAPSRSRARASGRTRSCSGVFARCGFS